MFSWIKNLFGKKEETETNLSVPTPLMQKLYNWVINLNENNILLHLERNEDEIIYEISEKNDCDNKIIELSRIVDYDKKTKRTSYLYTITKCFKGDEKLNFEGLCRESTHLDNKKLMKEMWHHANRLYGKSPEGIEIKRKMEKSNNEYENFVKNF